MRRAVPLLLLLLTGAAPAAALAATEERTSATGELVVSWRGDTTRGCAEQGVCDVAGTIVVTPRANQGTSVTFGGGEDYRAVDVDLVSSGPRVVRGPAGAPLGVCADAGGPLSLMLLDFGPPDGAPTAAPPRLRDDLGYGLSAGRCAGPAARDLAVPLLPDVRLPAGALARRTLTVDLAGRRTYAAGPYTIDAVSTLAVRSVRREVRDEHDRDGGGERDGPPVPRARAAMVMRLASTGLHGTLTTRFGATPGPGCELFDACGVAGAQSLTARPRPLRLELRMTGPAALARGPRRTQRMLAALRAGRLAVEGYAMTRDASATIDATVTRQGGPGACRDRLDVPLPSLRVQGGRLALGGEESAGGDRTLRSRCPGPRGGTGGVLASARIDHRALAAGRLRLRLRPRGDGDPWPYAATTTGALTVDLRRTGRIRVRLERG